MCDANRALGADAPLRTHQEAAPRSTRPRADCTRRAYHGVHFRRRRRDWLISQYTSLTMVRSGDAVRSNGAHKVQRGVAYKLSDQ